MQKKLWIAFISVCILFSMLIGRIIYIQYTSGNKYEKQVLAQQDFESSIIPYKRGDITDRNGTIIATSVDVYTLILDAYVLNHNEECIDTTIKETIRVFPQIDEDEIERILKESPSSRYNVLLKDIDYDTMTFFSERMEESKEDKEYITGVWFEKSYKRVYPYGSLACDLLGFVSDDGMGAIGLENQYNEILSGINGRSYGYIDNEYKRQVRNVAAQNGKKLITTLDVNIQSILESEITQFNQRYGGESGIGSKATAGIVMNPKTGEVYAMADFPGFDLNNPRNLEGLYTKEELDALSSEEKMDILNDLWQNFCITHTYEPGSTFKPFTVAAGIESGILTGNESYYCDGYETIGPDRIACVNKNGHGMLSVEGALMESCNDAFMQMSYAIGADNFAYYQRLFGFGQRTNVDITGEARTDSLLFGKEDLEKTINIATNSFGQNFNVTMIQMAAAFSSLINGGNLYEPHVVKTVLDSNGNTYEDKAPIIEKQTVSKETSEILKHYLGSVVSAGTGNMVSVEGYSIGGKTGTAEKLPRDRRRYLVSFIGFAPVEDPEVVVYIVVDEPNVSDQAHSSYAMEIANKVFEQTLPYLNIEEETVEETND